MTDREQPVTHQATKEGEATVPASARPAPTVDGPSGPTARGTLGPVKIRWPMFYKLMLSIGAIALIPYLLTFYTMSANTEKALERELRARLTAVAISKADRIETFANNKREAVTTLAQSLDVITAFIGLDTGRDPDLTASAARPQPNDAEGKLLQQALLSSAQATDGRHAFTAPLRQYVDRGEYTNLFLIRTDGEIIYSASTHTMLSDGVCRSSEIRRVFDNARTLLSTELSNFVREEHSDTPAAFVAAPTIRQGRMLGVVVLQLSNREIYDIVNEYSGLGDTGEVVVGNIDGNRVIFASPTRHDPDAAFQRSFPLRDDSQVPLQLAVRGIQAFGERDDYRGVPSIAVSRYLPSLRWGMVVKQDVAEAFAHIDAERRSAWIIGAVTIAVLVLVTWFVALSISRPVLRLTERVHNVAAGDLSQEISSTARDEIGELSRSFNHMTSRLRYLVESMEEEVRTRTADLERANTDLRHARDAAESANRSKSAFLANMSHELRTPLNAIIGYTELLIEDAEDAEDEQRILDLSRIHASGIHLLDLISDILDLSKVEAGKEELHIEYASVPELITTVVNTVKPRIDANRNRLQLELSNDLGWADIDVRKIKQVLINLTDNAAKFTQNGTITLRARRAAVKSGQADSGDTLSFSVEDTGIGIPASKFPSLFQVFEQLDSSTTRRYGGTGLGLALSQKLASIMGGQINVISEVGKGTCFTFTVPVSSDDDGLRAAMQARAATTSRSRALSPHHEIDRVAHILVIDDSESSQELMRRSLESEGFSVACAADGEAGLRLINEKRPDVVLLDVLLPGIDGWTLLSVLKSDPRYTDIPVIMVTIVDDRRRGMILGVTDYLVKPIERKQLIQVIRPLVADDPDGHILLVEDDESTREATRRMLRAEGWHVTEARNGRDGLDKLRDAMPSLVVLDLMMPEIDGFGFLQALRQEEAFRDTPVVVLTAKDITDAEADLLRQGLATSLKKGEVTREKLVRAIRMKMRRRKHPRGKRSVSVH